MNYGNLFRNHYHHLGYGLIHYFFSMPGQSILISLFKPHFNERLALTDEEFGLIYSIGTLMSAFTLPFFGRHIDEYKIRYVSIVNGLLLCFFTILISFSWHWSVLLFGIYGLRFAGQGMMTIIASTAISRYFSAERGMALSLSGLGLSLGEAILPVIVVSLIGGLGWPMAWQMLGMSVLVIFIPLAIFSVGKNDSFQLPLKEESAAGTADVPAKSRKEVLREGRFYLILLPAIFPAFILTGLFVHQDLLARNQGWTMEWLATCFIGFGIIKIITYFMSGPLVDLYTARRIFPFFLLPLAAGIFIMAFFSHPYAALIYLLLAGISNTLGAVLGSAVWVELYGVRNLGSIKSALSTFSVAATSVGAILFGWLLRNSTWMHYSLIVSVVVMILISFGANRALKQL